MSANSRLDFDFSRDVLERMLFKKMLTDKSFMNMLASDFDARWIATENLGKIIKLGLSFFKKYNQIPNLKIIKALTKKYFEEKTDVKDCSSLYSLIDNSMQMDFGKEYEDILTANLVNFIRKQALWTSMMDNAEDIEKNPDGVLDKCLERFDKITKITLGSKDLGMNFFNPEAMEKHWNAIRNPDDKIPTGWESLDEYMTGGFYRSGRMLAAFMGQAGLGKSLFLSNLAVNCLKNDLKVVLISLEMSQDIYAMRFDAHISGENINKLKENEETTVERIKRFYEAHPSSNLYIKEYPPRTIRCRDIEMYLDNLKLAGETFDVIIIDYLNLVLPNHSVDNMYKDVQAVSEQLRALSYKYECPIWTATQSNSEGINNENIDMQNVSESRGITHTLDFLAALYQLPEDREEGIIKCRILKNRLGGQVGKVCLFKMHPTNLTLEDITYCQNPSVLEIASEATEAKKIKENIEDISFEID